VAYEKVETYLEAKLNLPNHCNFTVEHQSQTNYQNIYKCHRVQVSKYCDIGVIYEHLIW
jgi:hypothetical protein